VWLDEVRPRAGRTVPLKVLTRSYRGEEKISTVPIEIPANVSGSLSLLVTDGRQLNAMEQRDLRRSVQPQSVAQMIRVLNDTRRNNRIYIRLLNGRPGAVVNGEALTALPPSVLSVLEADSNGGSYTPIRNAAVGEWELTMDAAVSGSRVLAIDVEARAAGRCAGSWISVRALDDWRRSPGRARWRYAPRCSRRHPPSGPFQPRPTSSKVMSRISRSTATGASSRGRQPRCLPKPRHRFSGR
jgi:hypothetical protein